MTTVSFITTTQSRGGEWYLEKRGSRKILARSRNLGNVFDKSRSLVFSWFVFTFFEYRNFSPKSLGLGFLTRISASRRVSDFTIRHPSESMNNRIKTRMKKKKLSWPECVQQLKEMLEEQERNINRALINEGPYRIRPECRRLIIPAEKWPGMSKDKKERKLKEFQKIPLSKAFGVSTSATISSISLILEAATEGMPSFFWQETRAEWKTWWTMKPVFCQRHNWIPTKNNRY